MKKQLSIFMQITSLTLAIQLLVAQSAFAINFTHNKQAPTFKVVLAKSEEKVSYNVRDTLGIDSSNRTRIVSRQANTGIGVFYFYSLFDEKGNPLYISQALELDQFEHRRIEWYLNLLPAGCEVILSIDNGTFQLEGIHANCK